MGVRGDFSDKIWRPVFQNTVGDALAQKTIDAITQEMDPRWHLGQTSIGSRMKKVDSFTETIYRLLKITPVNPYTLTVAQSGSPMNMVICGVPCPPSPTLTMVLARMCTAIRCLVFLRQRSKNQTTLPRVCMFCHI